MSEHRRAHSPALPVDAEDARAVTAALSAALSGTGPAVQITADRAAEPIPLPPDAAEDAALVVSTSGSTGVPKRVLLAASALRASAAASAARLSETAAPGRGRPDRDGSSQWLLTLPLHYVAGAQVIVRSILAGTDPVVANEGHFTAERFTTAASALTGDRRFVSLVPAQLHRLVEAADSPRSAARGRLRAVMERFEAILVGGQSTPASVLERCRDLGWPVVTTYGASETAGGCVYSRRPLPGVRVIEREGELLISGPMLAQGYLDGTGGWDLARGERAFATVEGIRWYRTGDAGRVPASGLVEVHGRLDDVLISGGEKVQLGRVETLVRAVAGYELAVAVAVPDERWGQVPAVVLETGDESALRRAPEPDAERWAQVRARASAAGRAARPALRLEIGEFPRARTGKLDRRALERQALLLDGDEPRSA